MIARRLVLAAALAWAPSAAWAEGRLTTGTLLLRVKVPAVHAQATPDPWGAVMPWGGAKAEAAPWMLCYLEGGPASAVHDEKVEWRLGDAGFDPPLLAVGPRAHVRVVNVGVVGHEPFCVSESAPFKAGLVLPGRSFFFKAPKLPSSGIAVLPVFCSRHPLRQAFVFVVRNRWFHAEEATPGQHVVRLEGVLAGDYVARVWHPGLHDHPAQVSPRPGGETQVDIALEPIPSTDAGAKP